MVFLEALIIKINESLKNEMMVLQNCKRKFLIEDLKRRIIYNSII